MGSTVFIEERNPRMSRPSPCKPVTFEGQLCRRQWGKGNDKAGHGVKSLQSGGQPCSEDPCKASPKEITEPSLERQREFDSHWRQCLALKWGGAVRFRGWWSWRGGGSGAGKLQAGIPAIRQMGSDHEGFLFQAKEFGPLSLMKETLPRILNWKATCLHQILFVCSATVFAVCPHCWRLTAMDSIGPSVSSLGLLWESVTNQVGYSFPVLEARSLESRCRQGWFPLEFLRENLFMPLP